jgi:hypothetical protein
MRPNLPRTLVVGLMLVLASIGPSTAVSIQSPSGALVLSIRGVVRYTEGATTYFTVTRMKAMVTEVEYQLLGEGNLKPINLPAGEYELRSYVRPRQPGLPAPLAAPQDECAASFSLKEGDTVYATRMQTDVRSGYQEKGKCELTFSATLPPLSRAR